MWLMAAGMRKCCECMRVWRLQSTQPLLLLLQGVTKNSRKERLAAKFVENEFEKVDRLMEVIFR